MAEAGCTVDIAAVSAAEGRDEALLQLSSIGDGADMEQNASRGECVEVYKVCGRRSEAKCETCI